MPLRLVLGPANSAKAAEVLGAFADASPRGALLVVPTAPDVEHYGRELSEQGCVVRSVLTFSGLAAEIARRAGYTARRLTALQRERVLARAVRGCPLAALGEVAGTPGFAAAAGELFAELERSAVSGPRLAAALARWAAEDPRREPYARDVSSLYLGYGAELERLGRVDGELFTWKALDALRAAPGRWGSEPVFFYGFDDLHELERDAIETLARVVGVEVTVSLTYEPGRPALSARAGLVAELRELAASVTELPALDEYYAPASRSALHHLERTLFEPAGDGERIDPGDAVRLLEAAGELAELELVAAEVRGLLARGVAAEEIVVVYRSLHRAGPATARLFERYGIPVAFDARLPFGHTALGRGLLALARCALLPAGRATADDVLAYARTPGVARRIELVDGLELAIRAQALRGAEQARACLPLELEEIDALAAARDKLGELARQGRRLLAAPARGQAPLLGEDERRDAAALAALLRCRAELAELGDAPVGQELIELLESLQVTLPGRPAAGAVLLADPLSIRARRFGVVFVCGLQEGAFPASFSADPFLSDEHRRELAVSSGLRLRLREDALDRERYLFYAAVSRATEQVVLSYRSSDEEGNIELPSPFVDDVAEVLDPDWRAGRRRRLLADVVWSVDEAPTARERQLAEAWAAAQSSGAAVEAVPPRRLTPGAMAHVRHSEVVSAGALESYAGCPMKWLVERELRPVALEPQAEPLARGSWVHGVLDRVLTRLGSAVTPESLPEAMRLLDEELAELSPRISPGRSEPLRRAVAETIAADLRRYLEYEASCRCGWEPRWLELRFGFEDEDVASLPPLVLGEGDEQVTVRGAIDRVDVDPSGRLAAVRDYKSGTARPEHQGSRWRLDRQIQVALYMVAVRQLLGLEPVAGLYQPLSGRDLRPRGVFLADAPAQEGLLRTDARDAEALHDELKAACAKAVELAGALRAGELDPTPETCSRDGCRYPGICRA